MHMMRPTLSPWQCRPVRVLSGSWWALIDSPCGCFAGLHCRGGFSITGASYSNYAPSITKARGEARPRTHRISRRTQVQSTRIKAEQPARGMNGGGRETSRRAAFGD